MMVVLLIAIWILGAFAASNVVVKLKRKKIE